MRISCTHYFTAAIILLCVFSCENEESLIGDGLVASDKHIIVSYPESDLDNFNINQHSMLNSNMSALAGDTSLLGIIIDPVYGSIEAGFAFQIKPTNTAKNNLTVNNISEISLTIPYLDFYAEESLTSNMIDLSIISFLNMHNLTDLTNIYIHETRNAVLGDFIIEPLAGELINLADVESQGYLELNLTDLPDLKNNLVDALGEDQDLNTLQTNFVNNFPGLFLQAIAETGAIMFVNTNNAILNIVYNADDTLVFDVGAGSSELIKLNYFHSHTGILDSEAEGETIDSDKLYLESMGGAFSVIEMPFLNELKDKGYVAVNHAELIFQASDENCELEKPGKISLYEYIEEDLSLNLDNNYLVAESSVFNSEDNTYTFNLTLPMQDAMEGEINSKFRLYTNSTKSAINGIVLDKNFELNLLLIKETE